jgi:magnesium-protoporphyrin O-methyltransferase
LVCSQVDDKRIVTEYFNTVGFDRWRRIYSESEQVNRVQLDIRRGHAETVRKILTMLDAATIDWSQHRLCDAGCGVGSLAIPIAQRGPAWLLAFDISAAMTAEARERAQRLLTPEQFARCEFRTADLEALQETEPFDTVCCVDVMIHYPTEQVDAMLRQLSKAARQRLIISFAPRTFYYVLLKRIGDFFPGPSKATRAYLHSEKEIRDILQRNGWRVQSEAFTATRFYFSKVLEAVR